jgi:DNA-binding CsgD family transcriptional regulator
MLTLTQNSRSSRSTLVPKYARLRTVLEDSSKTVEGGGNGAPAEVADLQRRAIASLRECADVALKLAECLGDVSCPRDITCLHLGDWNRCDACFDEQVSRFFDQASKFMTAIAASAEPGPLQLRKAAVADSNSCDAFPERTASFTEAQQRVFDLLMTGLENKLIAYELGVSEATIKAHVSAVLRKLSVRNRAQAIALSLAFERNQNVQSTVF